MDGINSIGVLMTRPMPPCLEEELNKRFRVYKFWDFGSRPELLHGKSNSIRAVVTNAKGGVNAAMIDALPKLEIVATYSVGFDSIDLERCRERGIRVTNTPDVLTDDVADTAIALALATLRRICECDRFVRRGAWMNGNFKLTAKFSGKSVGIAGLGRIGSAIAKRAEAFGCSVGYHSRSRKPDVHYEYHPCISSLASSCQILIVACSLTAQTRRIIDRKVLDALGPKGVLINIGRGALVDEPELVSALVEGRLAGAGLDVFEDEPRVPEQLLGLENVVLLPHVGSDTVETCEAMAHLLIRNLEAHFLREPLLTPVL